MKTIQQLFIKFSGLTVVILIALLAVFDLSHYGIPPTHDGEYHIMRFWQFYKNLEGGIIYPRWAPDFNNGFGIPLFNYVYPLPNYVASLFHLFGFGFIESLKLNFAFATITGSIFFYLWTKKYWGNLGGVVSSVFYTFSPYHFLDIYVRGSVGEVWSLALFPGLLWAYYNYVYSRKYKYFVLSAVFLALLILAHNILAVIFFSLFLLYALSFLNIKKNVDVNLIGLICLTLIGFGLAAPFWLPAILETKYVSGLQIFNPTDHFPKLYQLIYSSWGYGFSGVKPSGAEGQMSFQIGIANLLAVVVSSVIVFLNRKRIVFLSILAFFVFVFLITPLSGWLWDVIPGVSYVQFPWRLLSAVIVLASFLAGSVVSDDLFKKKRKIQILMAAGAICISIILGIKYAKAPFYHERADEHYLTRSNFTDGTNSPGNLFNTKWLKNVPEKKSKKVEIIRGRGNIAIAKQATDGLLFSVKTNENLLIQVNTAFFPGWVALVDNSSTEIINNSGIVNLVVPSGKHSVRIFLKNTVIQEISYMYFLFSILLIILMPKNKFFERKKYENWN